MVLESDVSVEVASETTGPVGRAGDAAD